MPCTAAVAALQLLSGNCCRDVGEGNKEAELWPLQRNARKNQSKWLRIEEERERKRERKTSGCCGRTKCKVTGEPKREAQ